MLLLGPRGIFDAKKIDILARSEKMKLHEKGEAGGGQNYFCFVLFKVTFLFFYPVQVPPAGMASRQQQGGWGVF